MLEIHRLGERDWPTLRDLRLRALRDSPDAFWATWEDESRFDESRWIGFVTGVAWFVASRDGAAVGMVGCLRGESGQPESEVIGMWVAPADRGRATADALLTAAVEWAVRHDLQALSLGVTDANERARRFYERHGFVLTGERVALPDDRGEERVMRRELALD